MVGFQNTLSPLLETTVNIYQIVRFILQKLYATHKEGFTIDPHAIDLYVATDDDAYIVSLEGCEMRSHTQPGKWQLLHWLGEHIKELSKSNHYVGMWRDGIEDWVYDVSIEIIGREMAIKFAQANHQEAIWDVDKQECVPVPAAE
jgi:hypothetical protein